MLFHNLGTLPGMDFDDVLNQVRRWLGSEVVVVMWVTEIGAAEG